MAPDTALDSFPTGRRAAALARALGLALLGAAATAASAASAGARADDGRVHLDFRVYGFDKPSAMVRTFKPTLNRAEESTNERLGREVDVRMRIAKDYDRGIPDLTDGRVDFSHSGPSSYVGAERVNPDLEILAMESIDRSKVFHGIIAVHEVAIELVGDGEVSVRATKASPDAAAPVLGAAVPDADAVDGARD